MFLGFYQILYRAVAGLVPVILPLLILPPQLIPKGITAAHGILILERRRDRAAGQAAEVTVTTGPLGRLRHGMIRVLVERGALIALLEADGAATAGTPFVTVEDAAGLAAGVAMAGTAHDVAELDAAGLAVPEEDAEDDEEDGADGDGQGDDEVAVFDVGGLRGGGPMGVKDEGDGIRGLVDGGGALLANHEGEGDVVRARALEVGLADLEWEEAPFGGDAVRLVELGEFAVLPVVGVGVVGGFLVRGAIEVVETDGYFEGGIAVVGLVEVVRVPGDLKIMLAGCLGRKGPRKGLL